MLHSKTSNAILALSNQNRHIIYGAGNPDLKLMKKSHMFVFIDVFLRQKVLDLKHVGKYLTHPNCVSRFTI